MRTMPMACAAFLLVTAGAASLSAQTSAQPQGDKPAADTCVVYSEVSHRDSRTLDVHLANTCSKPMACNIGWTVTCGKAASVSRNGAVLGGSAEKTWVASAESCTEDWSIDTTWSCKASK